MSFKYFIFALAWFVCFCYRLYSNTVELRNEMGYWKSKVLPKIKKVFEKKDTKKSAAAAEACKSFDESKVCYLKSTSSFFKERKIQKPFLIFSYMLM